MNESVAHSAGYPRSIPVAELRGKHHRAEKAYIQVEAF